MNGKFLTKSLRGFFTRYNLILVESTSFLLNDSRESKGASVFAFVKLRDIVNFLIASGVIPRFLSASKVTNLGSSYQEIFPSSMSDFITLFETGIPLNSSLENSITFGFLIFSAFKIA